MEKLQIWTPIFYPDIGGPASYSNDLIEQYSDACIYISHFSEESKINYKTKGNKINRIYYSKLSLNKDPNTNIILRFLLTNFKSIFLLSKTNRSGIPLFVLDPIYPSIAKILSKGKNNSILRFVGDPIWESMNLSSQEIIPLHLWKPNNIFDIIKTSILRSILKTYNRIIVPSQFLSNYLQNQYRIDKGRIKVLYNPVKIENLGGDYNKKEMRDELNLSHNDLILVTAGRLVPWKNIDISINLLNDLKSIAVAIKLIIIGSGPSEKSLIKQAKDLGLDKSVIFVNRQEKEKVHQYFFASDIYTQFSSYEGLSHTIIEAWMSGLEIFVSDIPANRELASALNEINLLSLNDVRSFSLKYQEMITKMSKVTIQNNSHRTHPNFSWEKHISELKKVFFHN